MSSCYQCDICGKSFNDVEYLLRLTITEKIQYYPAELLDLDICTECCKKVLYRFKEQIHETPSRESKLKSFKKNISKHNTKMRNKGKPCQWMKWV